MSVDLATLLKNAKTNWRRLLQASTWIMVILGSFVLVPPIWDFKEDAIWFRFTHFIVAGVIGLLFFPISTWSGRRYRVKWWISTIICLILGIIFFFQYQSLRSAWTIEYFGNRVIVGRTYTQDAYDYKAKILKEQKRSIQDEELIMDYAGDTKSIWIEEEIRRRRLIVASLYVALISLFAISIITLIQAI